MTDTPYAPKADTRDLRDPQKLGEALKQNAKVIRERFSGMTLGEVYDATRPTAPNYPQDESLATVTAREYRQELIDAAGEGDQYAYNLLLEKGWRER